MLKIIKSAISLIKSLLIFLLLTCLVIFMIDNREIIKISTYPLPFTIEARTFLVMFFFFLTGVFCGFLAFSKNMISKSINHFKDRRQLESLKKELEKKDK